MPLRTIIYNAFCASILGAVSSKGITGNNWNEMRECGVYNSKNANSATGAPSGAFQWGLLLVLASDGTNGETAYTQIYFANRSTGIPTHVYVRVTWGSAVTDWGSWVTIV